MRLRNACLGVVEAVIARASSVGRGPFFDEDAFPWARRVEAGWSVARAELDALLADRDTIPRLQDVSPAQREITTDDGWRSFFLFAFGRRVDDNCRRCPGTADLLEQIPGLTSAFFSILAPGKHVPAHRGPYNGLLRFHLGVRIPVPEGACRIRVGDETRRWRDGGSLFFDDTFPHEVWNDSAQDRAVIFVDFRRPLPFPVSLLNRLCLGFMARPRAVKAALADLTAGHQNVGRK